MTRLRSIARILQVAFEVIAFLIAQRFRGGLIKDPEGPERLRKLLEHLGGIYIKVGQLLALQPDVLPIRYCNALFDLMDRVPPFPFEQAEAIFVEELGKRPDELFDRFDRKPIAAASISQVHCAWSDGKKLAVKIQRPEVPARFQRDLRALEWVASMVDRAGVRSLRWFSGLVEELSTWTYEELDFRQEARYQLALGHHARHRTTQRIPELVAELSTRRVIVGEFLEGPTLLEYLRGLEGVDEGVPQEELDRLRFRPEVFAHNVLHNFMADAFEHGLFHADLHPGNLILLPSNVVGYVDFGITSSFSRHTRRAIAGTLLSMMQNDSVGLAEHFIDASTVGRNADLERFRADMQELMESWFDETPQGRHLNRSFTQTLIDMLRISAASEITPTADGARYLRSVISIDGFIRRVAPSFDLEGSLEELSHQLFAAESIRERLAVEKMADLTSAAARLGNRLPQLVSQAIDAIEAIDDRQGRSGYHGRQPPRRPRPLLLACGLACLGAAVLAVFAPAPVVIGWNLWTLSSSVVFLIAALYCFALLSRERPEPG